MQAPHSWTCGGGEPCADDINLALLDQVVVAKLSAAVALLAALETALGAQADQVPEVVHDGTKVTTKDAQTTCVRHGSILNTSSRQCLGTGGACRTLSPTRGLLSCHEFPCR
jgi:hypothetical protein